MTAHEIKHNGISFGYEDKTRIVKRLYCDCCEAFYDFTLTPENKNTEVIFVCNVCEENIMADLKEYGGLVRADAQGVNSARNSEDELLKMRMALDKFIKNNVLLESACTDWDDKRVIPTVEQVYAYFKKEIK